MDKPIAATTENHSPPDSPRINKKGIMITVFGAVFFMTLVLLLFLNKLLTQPTQNDLSFAVDGIRVLNEPRSLEPANFVDHNNIEFNSQQFEGSWNLVFFGFTHCPHICPLTLTEINRAYENLPESIQQQTKVYLMTVDPERDKPEILAQYVSNFNATFSGLTGEFVTLKSFAESVYVPFFKIREDALAPADEHAHHDHGQEKPEPTYDINHGSQVVIINPDGEYHGYYFSPVKADAITKTLPELVTSFTR
jgi:protein SCO1/2